MFFLFTRLPHRTSHIGFRKLASIEDGWHCRLLKFWLYIGYPFRGFSRTHLHTLLFRLYLTFSMLFISFIPVCLVDTFKERQFTFRNGPRKRKVGCSNPSRDIPKSLKQAVTAPLPSAGHLVWMSRVLGDDHYKRIPRGTLKNPHCSTGVPSIGRNLRPFTGNGDFSKWVKNSRLGQRTTNKQTMTSEIQDFFFRKLQALGHLKHRKKSPFMIKPDFQASVITIMFHFNDTLYPYYYIFCKLKDRQL